MCLMGVRSCEWSTGYLLCFCACVQHKVVNFKLTNNSFEEALVEGITQSCEQVQAEMELAPTRSNLSCICIQADLVLNYIKQWHK